MNKDCLLENYDYFLPKELIAFHPIEDKKEAKLLVYDRAHDSITHSSFAHLFDFIPSGTTFVLNDTKVIKARLFAQKQTGGKIEILFHKQILENQFLIQLKGRVRLGEEVILCDKDENRTKFNFKILEILEDGFKNVELYDTNAPYSPLGLERLLEIFEVYGVMPIPPYIKRESQSTDETLYQSIFARNLGAIAAPTASLHIDEVMLSTIKSNFPHCFLTLHIGAGTFKNVECENILNHNMHKESYSVNKEALAVLKNAKKILCVGTTATRCVEYIARKDNFATMISDSGLCDLFLNPFNKPIKTDFLITNFHLPKSSLIMLVSAFVGREKTLEIYQEAIKNEYRFFSYGDGMLIL